MMLAGAVAGALWGFIPGILQARLGVNEIITTLMLNYVALAWIEFWVFGPWSEGGFQHDRAVPARGLAAAPDRLRRRVPVLRRPDGPPRACSSASWPRRSCGRSSSGPAGATRSG